MGSGGWCLINLMQYYYTSTFNTERSLGFLESTVSNAFFSPSLSSRERFSELLSTSYLCAKAGFAQNSQSLTKTD